MRVSKLTKFLILLPALALVLFIAIYPLINTVRYTFLNYRLGRGSVFIGFENIISFFTDDRVLESVIATFVIMGIAIPSEIFLGLLLAVLVDKPIRGMKFFRTIFSFPFFATPAAVAFLSVTIFYEQGGPVNSLLSFLGLDPIRWLSSPDWARVSVALVDIWQWTPFCFLIFLAGLQSIPQDLYEAAWLETKSKWQVFWKITFPLITPVFAVVLILRLMEAMKIFDVPAVMTKGGPGNATEVFPMLIYRTGLKYFNLGYASAMGFILLIVEIPLLMWIIKRLRAIFD